MVRVYLVYVWGDRSLPPKNTARRQWITSFDNNEVVMVFSTGDWKEEAVSALNEDFAGARDLLLDGLK